MEIGKKAGARRVVAATLAAVVALVAIIGLNGCDTLLKNVRELSGIAFTVDVYDNYGNRVTSMRGEKVGVAPTSLDEDGNADSSVLRVTLDGSDVYTTGNTCVFAEDGLERVDDFETPGEMEGDGDGFTMFDRLVNDIANIKGKARTVVISSQLGIPIAVYTGDEVEISIPDGLPKFTKLNIDGRALYIHRANYLVIDNELL